MAEHVVRAVAYYPRDWA